MSGLILVKFNTINPFLIRLIVCIGAGSCGFCSSIIWVAQSGYITQCASENNKNKLFALFWSFAFSNQIISNSLGTFVLGKISTTAYFYLMTSLSCKYLSFIKFYSLEFYYVHLLAKSQSRYNKKFFNDTIININNNNNNNSIVIAKNLCYYKKQKVSFYIL